jgi:S-adenosyl-L-methionine hydrolase (adenosine-forming)
MDSGGPPAVYFLSDYGTADEFAGVVRAVLFRLAPDVAVIDLSHGVPSFDVSAGAEMLFRCVPELAAGVVLAVVDPGVGTDRRGVALHVSAPPDTAGETPPPAPSWLVGPDNGLLVPAADSLGGADRVFELTPADGLSATFDGRDLFAPAAAHLVLGGDPGAIGTPVPPASLSALARRGPTGQVAAPDGTVVASVTWVDRFGNVQLDLGPADLDRLGLAPGGRADVVLEAPAGSGATTGHPYSARRVRSFAELDPGELGVLIDANRRVALVFDRASAAGALGFAGPGSFPAVRLRVVGDDPSR